MRAKAGDVLVLEPATPGGRPRKGVIRTVWGTEARPPYEVQWLDDDRLTLCFPGPGAHVEPRGARPAAATAGADPVAAVSGAR